MKRIYKRAVGRQKNLYFWTFHMRGVCWIPHGWGEEIYFLCFWWFLACAVPLVSWAGRSEGRWSEGAGEVAEAVVEVRGWMVSWQHGQKMRATSQYLQSTIHPVSARGHSSHSLRMSIPSLGTWVHFSCKLHWERWLLNSFLAYLIPRSYALFNGNNENFILYHALLSDSLYDLFSIELCQWDFQLHA